MTNANYETALSMLNGLRGRVFCLREEQTRVRFSKYFASANHFNDFLHQSESNGFITFTQYRELCRAFNEILDEVSALRESLMAGTSEEQDDEPAVITVAVQPGTEVPAQPSAPGHLRLRPLLVKVPAFFQTPITQARLSIPLRHGPNQPATKLFACFR